MAGTEVIKFDGRPIATTSRVKSLLSHPEVIGRMSEAATGKFDPARKRAEALIAFSRNPKLAECSDVSLARAVIKSAQLGLDCSGNTAQGYLVPYGNGCEFVTGYRGLIDLAVTGGAVRDIDAQVVYKGEEFEILLGTDPHIAHGPAREGGRGEVDGVYAIATLPGGDKRVEWMTTPEIEAIRQKSRGKNQAPWRDHWGEMARKTVIRRLCKYLPQCSLLETALQHENEVDEKYRDVVSVVVSPEDEMRRRVVRVTGCPASDLELVDVVIDRLCEGHAGPSSDDEWHDLDAAVTDDDLLGAWAEVRDADLPGELSMFDADDHGGEA